MQQGIEQGMQQGVDLGRAGRALLWRLLRRRFESSAARTR